MKRLFTILAVICMTLVFASCGQSAEPADNGDNGGAEVQEWEASLHIDEADWPAIDGATALAPYYEAMASKLLGVPVEEARQNVLCSKTDGAFNNLAEKKVDMIFCSLPSEEQVEYAADLGVEYECTPFLNGGFVFFVNKSNPVESLTVDQLYDIYSGKITNWKEVGGSDVDIIPYQRSEGSGSQTGLYRFIISKDEVMEAPGERMIEDMGGIVDAVAGYENSEGALGYSYYYYVANMHYSDDIKLIKIEGVEPSDETIANGTYPLINQSMVIIRSDEPEDSILREIIAWVTGEEGQRLGEETGYVPNRQI